MQQASQVVQLQCPQCHRIVKVMKPGQPGQYKLTCPGCGGKIPLVIKAAPTSPAQSPTPPTTPAVNNAFREPKKQNGDYVEKKPAAIPCAFGCGYIHREVSPQLGANKFICPQCKGITIYQARGETIKIFPKEYQPFRGKLLLLRKGWFNKEFKLNLGSNIVGRLDTDPAGNSDIAITDDPSMSRRSIDIRVDHTDTNGYMFSLKVLRATNPVLINREPLMPGESFSLNFEDSIILGKTQFRFVKDV